jgi:hypothetical protein
MSCVETRNSRRVRLECALALGLAALLALDRPDTRSWTFLPAHLYICRTRVPPGRHELHVTFQGRTQESCVVPVEVPAGGFTVTAIIEPR